jgi:hypothetical protein
MLTPPDSLIAGRHLKWRITIANADGPIPGSLWVNATYHDAFENGKMPDYPPSITFGNSTSAPRAFDTTVEECFVNGVDTLLTRLFKAPFARDDESLQSESLHRITGTFTSEACGTMTVSTDRFRLLPGPLNSVSIEDVNRESIPGPITLAYPSGSAVIYSSGFDDFGNRIGHIPCDWETNGTLHALSPPNSDVFRIIYGASSMDESGFLFASAMSGNHPGTLLRDSVRIINSGMDAVVDSAVTKDLNGNGYIDRIMVYFNKDIAIPLGYDLGNINVENDLSEKLRIFFQVNSVTAVPGFKSLAALDLLDTHTTKGGLVLRDDVQQTGWQPKISITGIPGVATMANLRCWDGAGPVIRRVVVVRKSPPSRIWDSISVTFSEPIKNGRTGDAFSLAISPDSVFDVFKMSGNESGMSMDAEETILQGIPEFYYLSADGRQLVFKMTNGREITGDHYYAIAKSGYISDASRQSIGILPGENNRMIRAEILDTLGNDVHHILRPSDQRIEGVLYFEDGPSGGYGRHGVKGEFFLIGSRDVSIIVYTLSGVAVASLVRGRLPDGLHQFCWDTRKAANGSYAVRLRAGRNTFVRRVAVLR